MSHFPKGGTTLAKAHNAGGKFSTWYCCPLPPPSYSGNDSKRRGKGLPWAAHDHSLGEAKCPRLRGNRAQHPQPQRALCLPRPEPAGTRAVGLGISKQMLTASQADSISSRWATLLCPQRASPASKVGGEAKRRRRATPALLGADTTPPPLDRCRQGCLLVLL